MWVHEFENIFLPFMLPFCCAGERAAWRHDARQELISKTSPKSSNCALTGHPRVKFAVPSELCYHLTSRSVWYLTGSPMRLAKTGLACSHIWTCTRQPHRGFLNCSSLRSRPSRKLSSAFDTIEFISRRHRRVAMFSTYSSLPNAGK